MKTLEDIAQSLDGLMMVNANSISLDSLQACFPKIRELMVEIDNEKKRHRRECLSFERKMENLRRELYAPQKQEEIQNV